MTSAYTKTLTALRHPSRGVLLLSSMFVAGTSVECEQERLTGATVFPAAQQQTTALGPDGDTYIRQGSPNQNQGTDSSLRVQESGKNRALLHWDQQAIAQAVGGSALTAARLEVTISDNGDNWGAAGNRTVELHRLTQAWTESGATWNCANDASPTNQAPDCAGATAWHMDGPAARPWVSSPTASRVITNGLRGVVELDVTADVAGVLAGGGAQYGWILMKTDEGSSGRVVFGSRESATPPRLVLTLTAADTARPVMPAHNNLPIDSTQTVTRPGESLPMYYRSYVAIAFDDSTSGGTIRALLQRYNATIVGGDLNAEPHGEYIVKVPDPGATFAALESLVARLESEPGVEQVSHLIFRDIIGVRGRYPDDAEGSRRVNWTDEVTDYTRSRLAVRAPLAWGCETGTYTRSRVGIGVIDFVFAQNSDLPARIDEPTDSLAPEFLLAFGGKEILSHGIGVAGIVAATGDNKKGIAGMVWGADVVLYAYGIGVSLPPNLTTRFRDQLASARAAGIRTIVTSAYFGLRSDAKQVRALRRSLRRYLTAGRGNLFVLPVGQTGVQHGDRLFTTLEHVRTDTTKDYSALEMAAAQLFDSIPNQIIFVAGTDNAGTFWANSDYIAGASVIAAPATDIVTLGNEGFFEGGVMPAQGTSFAAPFVAGVAAELLAMDSTLTAAQVTGYIVRGSREPRLSPRTGQKEPPPAVTGVPGTVYQLDAYGALTLLSRERQGTPICGYPVSTDGQSIVLERAPNSFDFLTVPGANGVHSFSVAQGGRLISVFTSHDDGTLYSLELDHRAGVLGNTASFVERRFLERDTVDLLWDPTYARPYPLLVFRRADSTISAQLDIVHNPGVGGVSIDIAPSGDWVALYQWEFTDACFYGAARWSLVPAAGGATQEVDARCSGRSGSSWDLFFESQGWSHDSRRAFFAVAEELQPVLGGETTIVGTSTSIVLPNGGASETFISGRSAGFSSISSDDSVLITYEADTQGCSMVLRAVANLGVALSSSNGCRLDRPAIVNAPPAEVAALGRPSGPATESRMTASTLASQETYLAHRPRRVRVN